MTIKEEFPATGEKPLINYGYIDIASGMARTDLYAGIVSGAVCGAAAGSNGMLSNIKFYSDVVSVVGNPTSLAFDLKFNLPQTIKGQTIVQVPCLLTCGAGGAGYGFVSAILEKVDAAGTVSGIISGASRAVTLAANNVSGAMLCVFLDTPQTVFKSNEKLRLRTVGTNGGYVTTAIGCDPMNRYELDPKNDTPSHLIMQTPFKVID